MEKSKEMAAMHNPDYEKLYHKAFNALTDAQQTAAQAQRITESAIKILRDIQCECEELYIEENRGGE